MPGFFFHYRQADDYCVDDAGVELDTFELAYLDAFETAREMWAELMSRRVDPRSCFRDRRFCRQHSGDSELQGGSGELRTVEWTGADPSDPTDVRESRRNRTPREVPGVRFQPAAGAGALSTRVGEAACRFAGENGTAPLRASSRSPAEFVMPVHGHDAGGNMFASSRSNAENEGSHHAHKFASY